MTNLTRLLTKAELQNKGIITVADGSEPKGWRGTSYDTYIGEIITKEGIYRGDTYTLEPRGIVWLVSAEDYNVPDDITGITTLRTTWTKQGILTLTVGIIDPNYEGPVSTALVNFSGSPFKIRRTEAFFRTVFFEHERISEKSYIVSRQKYIDDLIKETSKFSESFLTIDTLAPELVPKIFGLPRIGIWLAVIALGLSLFSLTIPPAWDFISKRNASIEKLETRVRVLEQDIALSRSSPIRINTTSEMIDAVSSEDENLNTDAAAQPN